MTHKRLERNYYLKKNFKKELGGVSILKQKERSNALIEVNMGAVYVHSCCCFDLAEFGRFQPVLFAQSQFLSTVSYNKYTKCVVIISSQ